MLHQAMTVLYKKKNKKIHSAAMYIYVRSYILPFNNCDQQTDKSAARVTSAVWGGVVDGYCRSRIYIYIELVSVGRALTTNTRPPPLPTECVFFRSLFGELTAIFSLFRRRRRLSRCCCQSVLTQFRPIFGPFLGVSDDDQCTEETKNRMRMNTTRLNRCRKHLHDPSVCILLFIQPAMK